MTKVLDFIGEKFVKKKTQNELDYIFSSYDENKIFCNFINPIDPIPKIIITIFEFILKNCKLINYIRLKM
jgi:hypothetical protein